MDMKVHPIEYYPPCPAPRMRSTAPTLKKLMKTPAGPTFVLKTHVAINVESCSDANYSRTDQFIRAQVQW